MAPDRGDATVNQLLVVFLIALAARAGWGLYRVVQAGDPSALEFPDEVQYWEMARSLWSGSGLRDELGFRATRMPLYPALLAPFTALQWGVVYAKALQCVVGATAAVLATLCGSSLVGRRVGLVAGLFVALDPFLIFSSALLLTETLFITSLLGCWWIAASLLTKLGGACPNRTGRWLVLGCVSALTVYARESTLGLIVLLVGGAVLLDRFRRRTIMGALACLIVVFVSLLPWAYRNHAVTGDWCFLTHRAGISLYDGVGPHATGASDLAEIKQMPSVRGLNEVEWNQYFLAESRRAIASDPARILRLAVTKLARMWNPVPNVATYQSSAVRLVAAAWTLPTFALALAGAVLLPMRLGRVGWRTTILLLLPALYLSVLHSLFIGSVRYRLGAIPMLEILAAVALLELTGRGRVRSGSEEPLA